TAGDLDVVRYHLAKFTTIEKIIVFSGKMFIGRGLKQNKPVATSSLIFVAQRKSAPPSNAIEVINYKNPDDNVEKCLENIKKGKNIDKKKITQQNLLVNVKNWNFITKKGGFIEYLEKYKNNSEDISIYYNHQLAKLNFNSKFYFDSGYSIDEKRRLTTPPDNGEYYYYPKLNHRFWTIKEYRGYWPNIRDGNSVYRIRLRQANQGYNLLDSKYKIVWSYANPYKFHFTSLPLVWARNQICAIGTEDENEVTYLFALLNSNTIGKVLNSFLRSENEKDLLISTTSVKEFVRVPRINKENQIIKDKIIELVKIFLKLEDETLAEYIDFSGVMTQKFDSAIVEG
ncbi:MAG: hypothetical protein AABY22_27370, partial [Nanoarchaeota archaeon]